jgi:hypothetical protein
MKMPVRLIMMVAVVAVLSCIPSYAQETEGLIPRLMKKFKGKEEANKPQAGKSAVAPASEPQAVSQEPQGLIPKLINKMKGKEEAKKAPVQDKAPAIPVKPLSSAPLTANALPMPPVPQGIRQMASSGEAGEKAIFPGVASMTKEELVRDIKEELASEEDIATYIPQLKVGKDAEGKQSVTFELKKGEPVKLEDLDKEMLINIYGSVNQAATKINVDRINEQLESIRQIHAVQQITRPPQVISRPPQPPQPPNYQVPSASNAQRQPPPPPPPTPQPQRR